jgi:hypothetical protein
MAVSRPRAVLNEVMLVKCCKYLTVVVTQYYILYKVLGEYTIILLSEKLTLSALVMTRCVNM